MAASIARLPQPQPISSRRWPGFRSSRSSKRATLSPLGVLEAVAGRGEARRAVGHRLVEPGRIEIVAEVVVRGDVLPRLARRIVAQPVGERIDPAEQRPWRGRRRRAARRWPRTARRSRPGRGSTIRPASTPCTSRPSPRSPAGPAPSSCAMSHDRVRARRAEAEPALGAVGKSDVEPAAVEPAVDLVEHPAKAGATSRASVPPPVAKRRSARTRCSPRVLMPAEL